jgi:23S rRNA pseudouridine2605 synthase
MSHMRLNKYLAHATGISRREADNLISAGRVTVNGERVSLGVQIDDLATIEVDHKPVKKVTEHTYLMLNKPVGYLCSRRSQGGVPTIFQLLPEQYRLLKPVGRLDKDSSGLILLTNDGDFAHSMTHPSFYKVKVYEVELDKVLEPLHQQMISDHGIALEDGVSKFLIERDEKRYKVTMHEGRNRQIRRTFAALGYTVTKLHRTNFGNYSLGDIKNGEHALVDID